MTELAALVEVLRQGGVVACPTETWLGLLADAHSEVDEVDIKETEDALLFSAVSLARNEEENQIERFSRASNSQWSMLVLLEPI